MAKERVACINGEIVPESRARISILDPGFTHGDAVFDTARTFGGVLFRLDEHLDRLYKSLRYMRIDPGLTKEEMADISRRVLDANRPLLGEHDDFWVFQRVTRGARGEDGRPKPTVVVHCVPLPLKERAHYYRDGIPVITPSIRRTPPEAMSPRAKVNNYINMDLATLEVRAQNPDAWAVLLDTSGNLAEGVGSNFFLVRDGALFTPRERFVLPGISRRTVLELAQELSIDASEADIDLYDAYNADEAFITSTSLCLCPVSTINGVRMRAPGIPGPVTDRLLKAYSGLVKFDIVGQYLAHLS